MARAGVDLARRLVWFPNRELSLPLIIISRPESARPGKGGGPAGEDKKQDEGGNLDFSCWISILSDEVEKSGKKSGFLMLHAG